MEAASVAWEPLGWKAVGFSEIEPFPCAVLKHRFPNTPNYGSLTEYQSWPLQPGSIDLLVGGTPCQSFSVAGLRKGLADPRGNLALVFLGLADKLKPRWIVWENVPGVLSSDGGRDFGSFLGALEQLGYGWAYRVLDAQYFGVPQRRRRVFVVASLGGRDVAASVLLEPKSVCWHPAPRRKKGQATAADAGAGVEAGSPIVLDRASFNQGQNAQYEPHIEQTMGDHSFLIGEAITFQPGNLRREAGADPSTTTTTTLKASAGDQMPHVAHPIAGFKWHQGAQAGSIGYVEGQCPTITTDKAPAVIHPTVPLDGMNLLSRLGPCGENHSMQNFDNGDPSFTLRKGGMQHGVLTPMAVRRLTPIECERLQGFPDNWSQIPWKGKPADQCPDGPRYKCAGNSMAVPVMRWIGEQIARVELSQNNPTK
jgi:DNA (cytosine-5)-methyltransferase 1